MDYGNPAVAGSHPETSAESGGINEVLVAIVEHQDVKSASSGGADDIGIVLVGKPIHRVNGICSSRQKRKIALVAELPYDTAITVTVVVIDLHNPGLVAAREHERFIVRRIDNGIAVGPIGGGHWMAIDIQVVEGVPEPDGIVILVEIYQDIAGYLKLC